MSKILRLVANIDISDHKGTPKPPSNDCFGHWKQKLEDLKVLRRSPDLFNKVKIGQGFTAYNKPYMGVAAILVKWP